MGAQWIIELLIIAFLFVKQYIIFFIWTSRVLKDGEDFGKWGALVTKMEMNGRENSKMSFPVKAIPLPVGGQVATGVTYERKT